MYKYYELPKYKIEEAIDKFVISQTEILLDYYTEKDIENIKAICKNKNIIIEGIKNQVEEELEKAETEYDLGEIVEAEITDLYKTGDEMFFEIYVYFSEDTNGEGLVTGNIKLGGN